MLAFCIFVFRSDPHSSSIKDLESTNAPLSPTTSIYPIARPNLPSVNDARRRLSTRHCLQLRLVLQHCNVPASSMFELSTMQGQFSRFPKQKNSTPTFQWRRKRRNAKKKGNNNNTKAVPAKKKAKRGAPVKTKKKGGRRPAKKKQPPKTQPRVTPWPEATTTATAAAGSSQQQQPPPLIYCNYKAGDTPMPLERKNSSLKKAAADEQLERHQQKQPHAKKSAKSLRVIPLQVIEVAAQSDYRTAANVALPRRGSTKRPARTARSTETTGTTLGTGSFKDSGQFCVVFKSSSNAFPPFSVEGTEESASAKSKGSSTISASDSERSQGAGRRSRRRL